MNAKKVSDKKKDKLVKKGFEVAVVTGSKKMDVKENHYLMTCCGR